jgi:hypothetical protein
MPVSSDKPIDEPKKSESQSNIFKLDKLAFSAWSDSPGNSPETLAKSQSQVRVLPNLFGLDCRTIVGNQAWWLLELPQSLSSVAQEDAFQELATVCPLPSCSVSQDDRRYVAVCLKTSRLVGDVIDEWGTPPTEILIDWHRQWAKIIEQHGEQDLAQFDLQHFSVTKDGGLIGLGPIFSRYFKPQPADFKKTGFASTGPARPFHAWLTNLTKDVEFAQPSDLRNSKPKNDPSPAERTAVANDTETKSRSPKFSLETKPTTQSSSAGTTNASQPSTKSRKVNPLVIWGLAAFAMTIIPVIVFKQFRDKSNKPTPSAVTAKNSDTNSPELSSTENSHSSSPEFGNENEPEPELDISGTEASVSPIMAVDSVPTPATSLMANRLDSFFAAIESDQAIDLTKPQTESLVSAEDIVRGSLGDGSASGEASDLTDSEATTESESPGTDSDKVGALQSPANIETDLVGRDSLTLAKSFTKHIVRMAARPLARESIARIELITDEAKSISPAAVLEITGKNTNSWTIQSPDLPGEMIINVQSMPAKNWELRFGVVCKSQNFPSGVLADPKTSTLLLQRLLTYQSWLNGQLTQARSARDSTQDTTLRRVMLEGIKQIEAEQTNTERIVDEWQKFDNYLARFFANHEIRIIAASSRTALDTALQADSKPEDSEDTPDADTKSETEKSDKSQASGEETSNAAEPSPNQPK